jgi:hypothetical protein
MPESLKPIAKAVAAFLAPFVISAALWAANWIGIEVAPDPVWVESTLTALLSTLWVYFARNTEKPV